MSTAQRTETQNVRPVVYISHLAKAKLFGYARKVDTEISGLGYVSRIPGKGFFIEDVFILKQECSKAGTEIDPAAIGQHMTELITNGETEKYNRMKLWWHFVLALV